MPSFKVIRASAGSGKTFNLTSEYLRLLFAETDAFRHILAVTFTNKATEEMKSRIINELHLLASDQPSKQLQVIINHTGLKENQIRHKAVIILKKLLHRYSAFSVTTIDAFFQKIIRSFTRELGIQEGYAIELDVDKVLSEVIDRLLINAGNDHALITWLTMFAESLIEKGESWNLRKGIHTLGKETFREEFRNLEESSIKRFADRDYLKNYKTQLASTIQKTEKDYREFGKKAMGIINHANLRVDDFSNKGRGPAGFLTGLADGPFREPTPTAIQAAMSAEKWCTAASAKRNEILALASAALLPLLQDVIAYYEKNHRNYFTAQAVLKNLYALGILIDLSNLTANWCSENNTFLLNEAPGFLHKIINDNDTPFIYEKAGYWFWHFMIDEFQDTSMMQWSNFKPLISNSLSQDYDNLAVGDTKQSIYRWRNSSWEILENQINRDFLPGIIQTVSLQQNWRSTAEIIQFNNTFFVNAAKALEQECSFLAKSSKIDARQLKPVTELYRDIEQKPGLNDNRQGYVSLEFLSCSGEEKFKDLVDKRLLEVIYQLLDKGYRLSDIAILTRKNDEAVRIADFLLASNDLPGDENHKLSVISDDALRIGSSVIVNFIIAFMQHVIQPNEPSNFYYLKSVFSNYLNKEMVAWNDRIFEKFPDGYYDIIESAQSYSLIELTEKIVNVFKLDTFRGEQAYLMALNDLVIEYSKNHSSDISTFLDYWNETGSDKPISAPTGQNAIRILTLHKSKGLEFRVTIIPYCNWELASFNKSFLWCRPEVDPFNKLPVLPVSFTQTLEKTIFSDDYVREVYKQYVDNLNLLYVAFTRAKEVLYVFCPSSGNEKLKTVSDLAARALNNSGYLAGEIPVPFNAGVMVKPEVLLPNPVGLQTLYGRLKIAFQGKLSVDPEAKKPLRPVSEGKILHDIFRTIETKDDIPFAVQRLFIEGRISADEIKKYTSLIYFALNDVQVSSWFSSEWKVLNESEIILPGSIIKRPDRVITKEDQTILIDYKFGKKTEASNEAQISEYARLLVQMGYRNVEAWLWYVILGKVIQIKEK